MALVTTIGLREHQAAIRKLDATVREELLQVARSEADDHANDLRARMRARGWSLAEDVRVTANARHQEFIVEVRPRLKPANLPLWLEHGTRHMPARPFHGPALLRTRQSYPARLETVLNRALNRALT